MLIEHYIHSKLEGLLVNGENEYFRCPYYLLEGIVDKFIHRDVTMNDTLVEGIDKALSTILN